MAGDRRLAARTSIACARPDRFSDWRAEGLRWPAGSRASVRARRASSRRLPGGNRCGPAAASSDGPRSPTEMSTATKLPTPSAGRAAPRSSSSGSAFPKSACVLRSRCRSGTTTRGTSPAPLATPAATAAFSNVNRPFASRRGATIGVHRGQIDAGDLVAALDQHVGQVFLRRRVAVLPRCGPPP